MRTQIISLVIFLSGCAGNSLPSDVLKAVYRENFGSPADVTQTAQLNPFYSYLRVEIVGKPPALLALGYVNDHPHGQIETWYSAQKEVIQTQNGRIVSTAGLPFDWRNVRFVNTPPSWADAGAAPQKIVRVHDEAAGYRYGIEDQLKLEAVFGVPQIVLPKTLPKLTAQRYRWYQEVPTDIQRPTLPASFYAVAPYQGRQTVVYSYQCLEPHVCLSLQRWPVEKEAP